MNAESLNEIYLKISGGTPLQTRIPVYQIIEEIKIFIFLEVAMNFIGIEKLNLIKSEHVLTKEFKYSYEEVLKNVSQYKVLNLIRTIKTMSC
jgi:hypothetical protein